MLHCEVYCVINHCDSLFYGSENWGGGEGEGIRVYVHGLKLFIEAGYSA